MKHILAFSFFVVGQTLLLNEVQWFIKWLSKRHSEPFKHTFNIFLEIATNSQPSCHDSRTFTMHKFFFAESKIFMSNDMDKSFFKFLTILESCPTIGISATYKKKDNEVAALEFSKMHTRIFKSSLIIIVCHK